MRYLRFRSGFSSGPVPHLRGKNLISEAREWSQWLQMAKNVQFTPRKKNSKGSPYRNPVRTA